MGKRHIRAYNQVQKQESNLKKKNKTTKMSSNDGSASGIKLPTFNGEESSYQIWWTRFQAYARVKRFSQGLGMQNSLPDSQEEYDKLLLLDSPTDDEKKKIKAGYANDIAIAQLTMAFESASLINKIGDCKTKEWPHGLAYMIVTKLQDEYEPKDTVSKIELRRDLSAVYMKKNDDPEVLFSKLAKIENKYSSAKYKVAQEELMATVLDKAPLEYAVILAQEQRAKGDNITMGDLKKVMKLQWRITHKKIDRNESESELVLSTFKMDCATMVEKGDTGNKIVQS